jgi:hypothetical protein
MVLQILLKHGGRTNSKDINGEAALMLAQDLKNEEVIALLEGRRYESINCTTMANLSLIQNVVVMRANGRSV